MNNFSLMKTKCRMILTFTAITFIPLVNESIVHRIILKHIFVCIQIRFNGWIPHFYLLYGRKRIPISNMSAFFSIDEPMTFSTFFI